MSTGDWTTSAKTLSFDGVKPESAMSATTLHIDRLKKGKFMSGQEARRVLARSHGLTETDIAIIHAQIAQRELEEETLSEDRRVWDVLPPGWFRKYLYYCRSSESPWIFHAMNSMALMSHHIGRRVFFHLPGQNVYAPISVFLCSPAGLAGRGQSVAQMAHVAVRAGSKLEVDTATPETLVTMLAEKPHLMFVSEEASLLLNPKDYMSDVTQQLCRLVDGDDELGIRRSTKKDGTITASKTTLNLLLSSSPAMLQSMPKTAISGGLMSRVILVWSFPTNRCIPIPEEVMSPAQLELEAKSLAEDLKVAAGQAFGKLLYAGNVKRYYEHWQADVLKAGKVAPEKMSHWYGRKRPHLHRIVMSMLASQGKGVSVDQDTLDRAIALLDILERKMNHVYRSAGQSQIERKVQAVIDTLQKRGGQLEHSKLAPLVWHHFKDAADFETTIDRMKGLGFITEEKIVSMGVHRKKRIYVLSKQEG